MGGEGREGKRVDICCRGVFFGSLRVLGGCDYGDSILWVEEGGGFGLES